MHEVYFSSYTLEGSSVEGSNWECSLVHIIYNIKTFNRQIVDKAEFLRLYFELLSLKQRTEFV